eukprot:1182190-Prorocentrum_minimum.AAC.3
MLVFLYFNLQQKGAEHHTFCRVVKGVHQVCIARSLMKLRERAMQSLTISNFDHTAEGVMFCPLFSEVEEFTVDCADSLPDWLLCRDRRWRRRPRCSLESTGYDPTAQPVRYPFDPSSTVAKAPTSLVVRQLALGPIRTPY